MFFFFVGGVNQRIKKVVQHGCGRCVNCKTGTMDLVEMAKTLSVFFVPVWDFNKETALICRRCNFSCPVSNYEALRESSEQSFSIYDHPEHQVACQHCGSPISTQWKFCPKCGVAADYQGK